MVGSKVNRLERSDVLEDLKMVGQIFLPDNNPPTDALLAKTIITNYILIISILLQTRHNTFSRQDAQLYLRGWPVPIVHIRPEHL